MNKKEREIRDKKVISDYLSAEIASCQIIEKHKLKSVTFYAILKKHNIKTRSISSSCKLAVKNGRTSNPIKKRRINSNGYVFIHVNGQSRILEHVYIYEQYLNRKLNENECIHHIDFNKTNNNIENLALMTKQQHSILHQQSIIKLLQEGVNKKHIKFDRESNEYIWNI